MTLARIRRLLCVAGLALGLGAFYACSLNPQPLPPGDTAEGGKTNLGTDASTGHLGDDGGEFGGGVDATNGNEDAVAAAPSDSGGSDTTEAGDAEDAGNADAPVDGPTDASDGGAGDAASDAEEGGE